MEYSKSDEAVKPVDPFPAYPPPPYEPGQQAIPQVVHLQPTPTVIHVQAPPNYMAMSILACLCFWPIGIFAFLKSNKVNKQVFVGDLEGALRSSRLAKKLSLIGFIFGFFCYVLIIVLVSIDFD